MDLLINKVTYWSNESNKSQLLEVKIHKNLFRSCFLQSHPLCYILLIITQSRNSGIVFCHLVATLPKVVLNPRINLKTTITALPLVHSFFIQLWTEGTNVTVSQWSSFFEHLCYKLWGGQDEWVSSSGCTWWSPSSMDQQHPSHSIPHFSWRQYRGRVTPSSCLS